MIQALIGDILCKSKRSFVLLDEGNSQSYNFICFLDLSATLFLIFFMKFWKFLVPSFLLFYFIFWISLVSNFIHILVSLQHFPNILFWYVVVGAGFSRHFIILFYGFFIMISCSKCLSFIFWILICSFFFSIQISPALLRIAF